MRERQLHVLDGGRFDDLEGFYDELERVLQLGRWGRNLDAIPDVLAEHPMTLRWVHAARSRRQLGFEETARWLAEHLPRVHPSNRPAFEARLAQARRRRGETLFETLVGLLRAQGDQVRLELVDP